jgi:hypothetical protein
MKALGVILIIAGLFIFIFPKLTFTKEETIADAGALQINKKENKTIDWPGYGAGIAVVAGVVVLLAEKKKD